MKTKTPILALALLALALTLPASALTTNTTSNGFTFFYPTEAALGEKMAVTITDSNPNNNTQRGLSCAWIASVRTSGMTFQIGKSESLTRTVSIEATADWLQYGANDTYDTTIACAAQDGRNANTTTTLQTYIPEYSHLLSNPLVWLLTNPEFFLALFGITLAAYLLLAVLAFFYEPLKTLLQRIRGKRP